MTKQEKVELMKIKTQYYDRIDSMIEEYNNNGKKTIALFCESFYPLVDGVITVANNYAIRLMDEYNVVIVCPRIRDNYVQKEYLVIAAKSSKFMPFNGYPACFPTRDKLFMQKISKLRIDLVHIHTPFMVGSFGTKLAKQRNIPLIGTFHTQFKKDILRVVKLRGVTNLIVKYIVNVFSRCDEVWTMNETNVETLKSYGYKGKTRLMPNGTELIDSKAVDDMIPIVKQKYGLNNKKNIFIFVGRIVKQKNIFLIEKALKLLKQENDDFYMLWVGKGPDYDKLQKIITKHNLQNNCLMVGKIIDRIELSALFKIANVHVFPSLYDTDGLVKYEAAAFGTPSILVKDSSAGFGIVDNETGFLIENNPVSLKNKLLELMQNPVVVNYVGQGAKNKLYIHWDEIVNMVANAYEEHINKK